MKCMLQAGGFATRLYPLTLNKAKALLEFRGKPIISHIVERVPRHVDILVTANRKFEADFRDWASTLDRPVELCIEEAAHDAEKKGAVGAIDYWVKKKNIKEDLIVIAADNYFECEIIDLLSRFNRHNTLIAVYDVGDREKVCEIGRRCQVGLVMVENGRIVRFHEKPSEAISSIVATGIYVLPSRILPVLARYAAGAKRDNLGDFISHLLGQEEVHAYPIEGIWLDVGDEMLKGMEGADSRPG